jgi:mannose-6-phosphate isomerase-like protein (cupin superfamily)
LIAIISMNAHDYISSGKVYGYCLGLLSGAEKVAFEQALSIYPELQLALHSAQETLNGHAPLRSIPDSINVRETVWSALENLNKEEQMDLQHLPLINKYSDYRKWLAMVTPLLPSSVGVDNFTHVLYHDSKRTQVLTKATSSIPDEVHDDLKESFIVLEGECECYIGEDIVRMKAGDFIDIPMYVSHNVRLVSPYVVAIVQHIAA